MMDRHKFDTILQAFRNGNVTSLDTMAGERPKEIVTAISHVFLFSNRVYKIYMRYNESFNSGFVNLGDEKIRKEYYKSDFIWNNFFSPHVYLKLRGIAVDWDSVLLVDDPNNSDDIVIEMSLLNQNCNVYDLLVKKKVTINDAQILGHKFLKRLAEFPKNLEERKSFEKYSDETHSRIKDLESFMVFCKGTFNVEEIKSVIANLTKYVNYFESDFDVSGKKEYGITIDCHTHNLYFENGDLELIDVYSPKKEWRSGSFLINVYRIGADIYILQGRNEYLSFLKGCEKVREISKEHDAFYLAYAALIKGPYIFSINPDDETSVKIAFEYKKFALDQLKIAISKISENI